MGYLQTFLPTEYIVKAVKRLPNHLRNSFYKGHSNIILEKIVLFHLNSVKSG